MTDWCLPTSFPDLSAAKGIGVDIETYDPDLSELGPGVRRGAYTVGVGIATDDGQFSAYYPVAHDEGPNLNKQAVYSWLSDELGRSNQIKYGANLQYDFDFLLAEGIKIGGSDKWYDIQIAEPLLDENSPGSYNLDAQARKYLGKKKAVSILEQECDRRGYKGKPQSHIWRMHAKFTGAYCMEDSSLPIEIFRKQKPLLEQQGLWDLFLMEIGLTPLLLQMRKTGVRIDTKQLPITTREVKSDLLVAKRKLNEIAGFEVEYTKPTSLAQAWDSLGLAYGLTKKTKKPSFTKESLKACVHPIADLVQECRTKEKFIGTFFEGALQKHIVNGRIHCCFNQLKSDEYGTVSGRFSASQPNLQQIPKKDEILAPLVRSLFIPEEGYDWCKADYSQVEYRLLAHYAMGPGSDAIRAEYAAHPDMDIHDWASEAAGIDRDPAKTLNFMIIYGGGKAKVAKELGMELDAAIAFLANYHEHVPFAKYTLRRASKVAEARGYVRTILNRRRRYVYWEPSDRRLCELVPRNKDPHTMRALIRKYIGEHNTFDFNGGIQRSKSFTALNAILQGSAAEAIKKAMVDTYRAGIYNVLIPHLTVHDELDVSVPKTKEGREAVKEMVYMMENAIKFRVPLLVEPEYGPNWGSLVKCSS